MSRRNKNKDANSNTDNFQNKGDQNNGQQSGSDQNQNNQSGNDNNDSNGGQNTGSQSDMITRWFGKYGVLTEGSASLDFPYKPGMTMSLGNASVGSGASTHISKINFTVPGVFMIHWAPSLGQITDQNSPANIVAGQLYAAVRNKYSGRLYASGSDMMIYLGALDSIFSYIAAMKRIYRTIMKYNPSNYNIPSVLLNAYGMSPATITNLITNKTQFWTGINELVHMSRQFVCPAVMELFNRHYWMNDNLFTDADSVESQLYAFIQDYYYQFSTFNSGSDLTYGLKLTPAPWIRNTSGIRPNLVYTDLINLGSTLINSLAEWDSSFTISGYLTRAFEGVPSFIVDEEPLFQDIEPIYSELVLSQIENATGFPMGDPLMYFDLSDMSVQQSTSYDALHSNNTIRVYYGGSPDVYAKSIFQYATGKNILPTMNSHIIGSKPGPIDVVNMTRLKTVYSKTSAEPDQFTNTLEQWGEGNDKSCTYFVNSGTETVLFMDTYTTTPFSGAWSGGFVPQSFIFGDGLSYTSVMQIASVSAYARHPMLWGFFYRGSGLNAQWETIPITDVQDMAPTDFETLFEINKVCLYSVFNAFSF